MTAQVESRVLDFGLSVLDTESTHIRICATEPTDYASATSGNALAMKNFGAGSVFGSPADASPNGRKVSSAQVTDGTVQTTGTANWWAITDESNSRLHAHGALSAPQALTATNSFTLNSFDISIPSQ